MRTCHLVVAALLILAAPAFAQSSGQAIGNRGKQFLALAEAIQQSLKTPRTAREPSGRTVGSGTNRR